MAIKVSIDEVTQFDITFYTKAGDTISGGEEYNVYYGTDGVNWTYLAGPLSSTSCTQLSTVTLPSPYYVRVERDIYADPVYVTVSQGGQCPPNNNDLCASSLVFYTSGNEDLGITVYVDGSGAMDPC